MIENFHSLLTHISPLTKSSTKNSGSPSGFPAATASFKIMRAIYILDLLLGFNVSLALGDTTAQEKGIDLSVGIVDSSQLNTPVELRIRLSIIKDEIRNAPSPAHANDRIINELAFRLVLVAENETLNTELLQAINEVEDVLGGAVVTAPVFFKEERDAIDSQIKAGKHPSYQRTMYIFDYTRKIRELAVKRGLPVPEYKGIIRGRL